MLVVVSTLALLGQGCARPTPSGRAPLATRGGCENAYYPLNPGSSITYRLMSGSSAPSSYRVNVLDSEAGRHRIQYVFQADGGSLTLNQDFTCEDGVISAKGYADFSQAVAGAPGFRYETVSVEGVFLPADLRVGSEWETTYNMVIRSDDPAMKAVLDGKRQTLRMKNTIVGEETVTVPAGTFTALRMASDVNITSEIAVGFRSNFLSETWLVRDVGMVKNSGSVMGIESITEAVEISD